MSIARELIDAIMDGNAQGAREAFSTAISDKVNTVLDIRRVEITSDVFGKVEEATMKKEFLSQIYAKDLPEKKKKEEEDEAYGDDTMYNEVEKDNKTKNI